MMSIAEAMGLALPGASSIPAADSSHPRMCSAVGRRITQMVWDDLTPAKILSSAAFDNAIKVADFLNGHAKVDRVVFPGLQTGEDRRRAETYLSGGFGALIGVEPKGGEDAALALIDNLKLIYHLANIGDARSLAIHPWSTTHGQLSAEAKLAAGVTPALVRLSIGIENPDDIIADLDQALARL